MSGMGNQMGVDGVKKKKWKMRWYENIDAEK